MEPFTLVKLMVVVTFAIAANDEPYCPEHHYPSVDSFTYKTECLPMGTFEVPHFKHSQDTSL